MRRIFLAVLFGVLLLAPSSALADPSEIIRDCADDSTLQGDYTLAELRNAQKSLPTDIDEYSDCRDVLSRAIAKATASSGGSKNSGGNDGAGSGAGTGGGTSGGSGTGGSTTSGSPAATPTPTPRPAIPPGPPTEVDNAALAEALNNGPQPVQVGANAVSPGASRLAASVGRNPVPTSLYAVFGVLLLSAAVALGVPLIRRRVSVRRPA